ncbi:DUF6923 family protein [Nocardioides sp.]|uniref:DUF6923 family protein n=1 Tax=Nocardioides sp. TaxID=35761 RepID=UPI0014561A61|nr:DUF11 domain-containing protein [Nocardioides sp.]
MHNSLRQDPTHRARRPHPLSAAHRDLLRVLALGLALLLVLLALVQLSDPAAAEAGDSGATVEASSSTVAAAAVGDPFDPTEPQQFVIVGTANSQLYRTVTASDGTLTLQEIGAPAPVGYNAIGYNTADNYIYGTVTGGNAEFPTGSIVRVDATGTLTRVGIASDWSYAAGTIGPDGLMTVGDWVSGVWPKVNPTTGAQVGTLVLSQPLNSFPGVTGAANDITYAEGYFWASASSHIFRINPLTGQVDAFPSPVPVEETGGQGAGAALTFGNGNLGFVYNETGSVVQVRVTDPGSASPAFEFVSAADGPANGNNDATSSPGLPADLEIEKAGPAWYVAGGQVSYTLTVTNNGPGVSSGQTITDTLPDGLTDITPPTGCTVADQTVTCVNGRLAIGASVEYTLTASAPNPATTCLTNQATVLGNEADGVDGNNEDSVESCPVLTTVDGTNTARFRITVTRTGDGPGYDLSDVFAVGEGITLTTVTSTNIEPGGISTVDSWDAATSTLQVVEDQPIADGESHVYLVTANATVDGGSLTYESSDCSLGAGESGTGFSNTARVSAGVATEDAAACSTPFVPEVEKTSIGEPRPLGGGRFELAYEVSVTNPHAGAGVYDLDDTLAYGDAVTVLGQPRAAAVTSGLSAVENTWSPGAKRLRIQTDQPIAAAVDASTPTVHTYRVTIRFKVNAAKVSYRNSDCSLGGGESGTGLMNRASITVDAHRTSAETCKTFSEPVHRKVVKSGPRKIGKNRFRIRYAITVTNRGAAATTYSLSDRLRYGAAVRIVDTSVRARPRSIDLNPAWNGRGRTRLVANQTIGAARAGAPRVHTYVVIVDYRVKAGKATGRNSDCGLSGGESGTGLLNESTMTASGESTTDHACQWSSTRPPPATGYRLGGVAGGM